MQWFRMSYIRKKNRVMRASAFLEGRALSFYTIHVGSKAREWSTNKFFIELFDFCFLSNWQQKQRHLFNKCHQNNSTVQEYVEKLLLISDTLSKVDPHTFIYQFWWGADEYIRVKWADNGYSPDILMFKELHREAS